MTRHHHHRPSRQLNAQLRRKLSEEGRRLLHHALAHGDDDVDGVSAIGTRGDANSVDLSVVSIRGDESTDSDLDSFSEWQEQPLVVDVGGGRKAAKRRGHKAAKDQHDVDDEGDELDEALEQLMEKRDTTKIQALQRIVRVLGSAVLSDRVQSTKESIVTQVLATLKKRQKDSSTLSLRVIGAVAITIGPDEQPFYDSIRQPLQRMVMDDSIEPSLRMEAAYALSIASYVCCREDQQRWELLETLGSLLVSAKDADDNGDVEDDFTGELLISLIECWAFLVSGFHPSTIVPKIQTEEGFLFEHVEALAGFVREGMNPTIRSAACEVLALLVQYKYIVGKSAWTYAMEETTSPLGGLESKIERYMRETAKSIGKKSRKTQRSMLKEVLETLHTGEGPHKDLQIDGETLSVSTWSRFFQANVFRRGLRTGFQVHLHENDVLREVFDVSDNANAKISMVSTVRRRADHRAKTINKRNDMSRKDATQNAFLFDE